MDWIQLHYEGKPGFVHTDIKRVGDFIVEHCGAIPVDEIETSIGTYYKYSVVDLAHAYKGMLVAMNQFECH